MIITNNPTFIIINLNKNTQTIIQPKMKSIVPEMNGMFYGFTFLVGGSIFTLITYLSNHVSTRWSAILSSLNFSIFTTLFIHKNQNIYNFVWNEIWLALTIALMSLVFYITYSLKSRSVLVSLILSQIVFVGTLSYLYTFVLQ